MMEGEKAKISMSQLQTMEFKQAFEEFDKVVSVTEKKGASETYCGQCH